MILSMGNLSTLESIYFFLEWRACECKVSIQYFSNPHLHCSKIFYTPFYSLHNCRWSMGCLCCVQPKTSQSWFCLVEECEQLKVHGCPWPTAMTTWVNLLCEVITQAMIASSVSIVHEYMYYNSRWRVEQSDIVVTSLCFSTTVPASCIA